MKVDFDYLCDIILHVSEVSENMETIASELRKRGITHDRTKFQELEFDAFVSTRDKFKKANYGSPEYQECVDQIKPAIDHHHSNNRHHPDFHPAGIKDMTLVDICEMISDWKAASRRSPSRKFEDTLDYNFKKYGIEGQLAKIITNTLTSMGWIN